VRLPIIDIAGHAHDHSLNAADSDTPWTEIAAVARSASAKHRQTFRARRDGGEIILAAMRPVVRRPRPHRHNISVAMSVRPKRVARIVTRAPRARVERRPLVADANSRQQPTFAFDPYFDYGRSLTPEGGVLIVYKDIDERLRHIIWRVFVWSLFTGYEAWLLFHEPPIHTLWLKILCVIAAAVLNWFIVRKPVELYRRVEIRPDCMILDGYDVFWASFMENGLPSFRPDKDGNYLLCGIYGTRFIEYLTVRKFDENDRMPEVMAGHLLQVMTQLWTRPS
jgi:hypothetical protein